MNGTPDLPCEVKLASGLSPEAINCAASASAAFTWSAPAAATQPTTQLCFPYFLTGNGASKASSRVPSIPAVRFPADPHDVRFDLWWGSPDEGGHSGARNGRKWFLILTGQFPSHPRWVDNKEPAGNFHNFSDSLSQNLAGKSPPPFTCRTAGLPKTRRCMCMVVTGTRYRMMCIFHVQLSTIDTRSILRVLNMSS